MNDLPYDTLQQIFSLVESPVDLLRIAQVNKLFYTLSRCNNAWIRQERRILSMFPQLDPLFEKYRNPKKLENGKKVHMKKRPKTEHNWVVPKGIWYVFARHLMFKNISQILSRKSSREYILDALCWSAMRDHSIVDIVDRSHVAFANKCRFQRCLCLRNFTFVWIGMFKGDSYVSVYTERLKLRKAKASVFIHNFIRAVRNERIRNAIYII